MGAFTAAIGGALQLLLRRRIRRLSDADYWARNTGAIQRRQLRAILDKAAETEFGREHDFAKLAARSDEQIVDAWRAAIPMQSYDNALPYFKRMRERGEPDVMWPGVVRDWAQTSGTTSGDKYVPVSKDLLRHNYRAALDVYANAQRFGQSIVDLYRGRVLFLGGSSDLSTNEHGVRTGDLSGVVNRLIRWPMTSVILPDRDIALMSDWPAKIDAMARACVDEDLRAVSGMPSWTLALFERILELRAEQGRPASCIREVWPDFRLFIHGGTRYAPFDDRIREIWSGGDEDIPTRLEVYAASEAFVAVQDARNEPAMRLNADLGVFYEFVPLERIGDENPESYTCDQVEPGRRYVVIVTSPSPLFRYNLGDVVEFDTVPPEGPARLRIVGRHRLFINAFGENIIVEHIENAVVASARETGVRTAEFTAAPVYPGAGEDARHAGLELAIEWPADAPADPRLLARFRDAFDRSLKAQNNDYAAKRSGDVGMAPPTITPIPIGSIHDWMESQGKLGGQHKCPRCANHRDILDALLAQAGAAPPVGV